MPTLLEMIDDANFADREKGNRKHLGGSLIGRKCKRQLWYSFRWARTVNHKARMLRLFNRGHREEFEFVKHLRRVGINVREYSQRLLYHDASDSYTLADWGPLTEAEIATLYDVTDSSFHIERAKKQNVELKQWRISDINGHFGGSLDGIADAPFVVSDTFGNFIPANEEFLCEFKTHNTKSFTNLVALRVKEAKAEHYRQMQTYMRKRNLRYALYMAVNKNDDDLYLEVVVADYAIGDEMVAKANVIINARQPPERISSSPTNMECKWCDFYKLCHYAEPMEKNCRTCKHSVPVEAGEWQCGKWNQLIPSDFVPQGCNDYEPIRD